MYLFALQMWQERQLFFTTALQVLSAAAAVSYQSLCDEADRLSATIDQYRIPDPCVTKFPVSSIDHSAAEFVPNDIIDDFVPLRSTPNGNCLFNAASILLVGNETMSTELRLRSAVALMQLESTFMDNNNALISQLIQEQVILYNPFAATDYRLHSTNVSRETISMVLQNEVITSLKDFTWSSMWQIQSLSTALGMSFYSVYPKENSLIRHLFHKIVNPILPHDENIPLLPILWSGIRQPNGAFKANHFVPLVHSTRLLPSLVQQQPHPKENAESSQPPQMAENKHATEHKQFASKPYQQKHLSSTQYHFRCFDKLPHANCIHCGTLILTQTPKVVNATADILQYSCSYCTRHTNKSNPLSKENMSPGLIPNELKCLNNTEIHMISQVHPYMKLAKLPVGGQFAQKGQCINIPVQSQEICKLLPRLPVHAPYVSVESAATTIQHIVNVAQIQKALKWLQINNHLYTDAVLTDLSAETYQQSESMLPEKQSEQAVIEEETLQQLSVIPNDYTVPATKKKKIDNMPKIKLPFLSGAPLDIFRHQYAEELAFPQLFPKGINGFKPHSGALTPKQYFTCRILNADNRWSTNPQYLFWALNVFEQHQLQSCISIAVRIGKKSNNQLQAQHVLQNDYKHHVSEDFRFMKQMKGTAAYWRNQLYDLLSKIQTLGPPTFFLSLSCNDSNWIEMYKFIDNSLSDEDIQLLSSTRKTQLLRNNPVKCAIYFTKRWQIFLNKFIKGPQQPLGFVTDHFARIEFQNRGSPHVHAFFWIKNAPNMETLEGRKEAPEFINKYISAQLPHMDDPLHALVSSLQTHSHTHTCYKQRSKTLCRFNFPRQQSNETVVQFDNIASTTGRFYKLARSVDSLWVNPYNVSILQAWGANMDIQVVGCKYAAASYVCTYVCKNEPESLKKALSSTISKLPENGSARKRLSKIGNILLTHRLISAQEAAFRLLNLPMIYSSRETIFISSYPPQEQFQVLKPKLVLKDLDPDSTDIYSQGLQDVYMRRPQSEIFANMSLVKFATSYCLLRKHEKVATTQKSCRRYQLEGQPVQWIREKLVQACFRTYIPNITRDPEKYFSCILTLFLPWRNHAEICTPFSSYEEAYTRKQHKLDEQSMKYFHYQEKLIKAVQQIRTLREEQQEDIHCTITPNFMASNIHDTPPQYISSTFEYTGTEDVAEAQPTKQETFTSNEFKALAEYTMTDDEYSTNMNHCNDEQKQILRYVSGKVNENMTENKLHLFITGGAGSGKSFLLKLLREHLLRMNTATYPNVLVAAPTGVAAFNIKAWTLHRLLHLDVQRKKQAEYHKLFQAIGKNENSFPEHKGFNT